MKNENGIEKSAILKGQTLVNLINYDTGTSMTGVNLVKDDDTITVTSQNAAVWLRAYYSLNVSYDKKYIMMWDSLTYTHTSSSEIQNVIGVWGHSDDGGQHEITAIKKGQTNNYLIFSIPSTSPVNLSKVTVRIHATTGVAEVGATTTIKGLKIMEYQEGMENWDIPYFEGMQSVKMPVLSTTGKNLFDEELFFSLENIGFVKTDKGFTTNKYYLDSKFYPLKLKPNTTYSLGKLADNQGGTLISIKIGDTIITTNNSGNLSPSPHTSSFTTDNTGIVYIRGGGSGYGNVGLCTIEHMWIVEGAVKGTYEPYKSNILTTPEEVELRGIGDVQDTLDCLTGEVTERISEIVLDGSEDEGWFIAAEKDNLKTFRKTHTFRTNIGNEEIPNFVCDKLKLTTALKVWAGYGIIPDNPIELSRGTSANDGFDIIVDCSRMTSINNLDTFRQYLSQNPLTVQYELKTPITKTVDLTITDQDNQPQERMKLFPNGYINTSSSTIPPILELKGIVHNNKLNMTTTNGTNNTQLATLDNLALDGIISKDGTVVRDSYDVESGLYTKRVFRFTIDEEFVEKYRNRWKVHHQNSTCFELRVDGNYTGLANAKNTISMYANNIQCIGVGDCNRLAINDRGNLYIRLLKEEVSSYDVNGILEWIKRNGAIEVAYAMATPQIIHMQPNMTPYVSTRPYQGSIESQGNILESSFLDYTSEQSIISPKPLGDGDVLRWEQGSQCYVYENDKEYIPLTNYNQPMGTVLDLEEEDGEQFVENLDGGDIIVDVPFKEKAVYERHLVSHEDNVIYPIQDKLDPTGKIEVDYICGETWQNPDDLSDIRHVGTLREDGQYDVTIRRSGDDEIRLMDGTTHISLDGDGLNPSEFELTFFNKGGVEVGKYGDTSHTLEDCVLDSKLETGTIYGETMVNVFNYTPEEMATWTWSSKDSGGVAIWESSGYMTKVWAQIQAGKTYTMIYVNAPSHYLGFYAAGTFIDGYSQTQGKYSVFTVKDDYVEGTKVNFYLKSSQGFTDEELANIQIIVVEGDYTNYPMDIPYFEGVGSTIVNGFTTTGKNLFGFNDKYEIRNSLTNHEILDMNSIIVSPDTTSLNWINAGFYNYYLPHKTTDYFIISRKEEITEGNPYDSLNLYDADDDVQMIRVDVWQHNGYKYDLVQFRKDGERANIRFYCGSNEKMGTIKYSDIQITKYSQRPSRINEEFEPHHSIQHTLPTPITLNKIGDVTDTYDVVSGKFTQRIGEIILDGSEDWTDRWGIDYPIDGYVTFNTNIKNRAKGNGLCENFAVINNIYDANEGVILNVGQSGDIGVRLSSNRGITTINEFKQWLSNNPITVYCQLATELVQTTDLIPSTVETIQEPTFILPQPLRSVPNGICDRLYWDENKGHYCIEKRVGIEVFDGVNNFNLNVNSATLRNRFNLPFPNYFYVGNLIICHYTNSNIFPQITFQDEYDGKQGVALYTNGNIYFRYGSNITNAQFKQLLVDNPVDLIYSLKTPEIIDLPHLNRKLKLPSQPNTLPIGYKVEYAKGNPQLGLTIPYKQLNYPSRPQNIDFKMDIADYVLTWDDVKEARQYNIILNDKVIATTKEPQWNSGEEMYGYIMVEAQNELAENLSEELYIKTVPNAPAQLTVAHNPMTDYYDFEISFIKTSAIAEYYTVQYRIDNGEWVYKTIQSDEIDPNTKVLWSFSVYEINEQIEVWATATNDIGTNDILPTATYYMSPTPQWTYRINSKELFIRWMDDSPYDVQYKLRYQYKSDGIYRYAYFEGDKQEIGKLYEALIPLADDEEVSIALCIMSEKENLYTKPIKASKELDPNIKPPKDFNYHWLARGLIEFYWEDNYDVDVEYEAIVEHRLTSGNNEWITDTRIFSATDTEGTGTVYRLSYQMEDLEEIRVKVRMKWAMNETEWSESLTTVFIPVEGNPPQWIRRTQTQEGLLVEWEAQEYVDSYHVYVMSNGEELQHLETMDNFIYVDLDYSNPIDIEIYEATRFSGGIQSDPTDKMCFRPTMDKHQLIHDVVTPDTLTYEIEVDTVQRAIKERQVIHDINTTPKVTDKQPMDVAISSPFTLSFHPLQLDVHQSGAKYYGDTELHIKTLDVKSRDAIEVLSFERITDQYGVDFTVYTPSASKYPITLEVNRVRIVCFGDSLTSGHPGFWAETGTGDPQHCYEYWLDRRLKGQYEIINKGYGSDTTDRMLARFDRDVLANNPQYCIIQGGTNDLYWAMAESMGDQEALDMKLDVMKANIMEMVKRCWDNNIVPIVGNLIPRTGATGIYKTALYDFNAWIISWCTGQAAEGRNIFYVDLFNAGKEAVPPTPIEDPTNPGAMNPIYDGDALFDEFGNIIKQGRGIHLNKEGYRIWAEAIPLSIFKTYDSGLRMYKDLHCTDEDNYDDSDKQNPFYTISIDNVRRSKTKTVVRYIKNIGKTQVLFAMYASDEYNMSIEFVGSDGEKGAYANGLLAPNMIAKVTMEINLDNKDSKASFNLHLAAREYNQN